MPDEKTRGAFLSESGKLLIWRGETTTDWLHRFVGLPDLCTGITEGLAIRRPAKGSLTGTPWEDTSCRMAKRL